MLENLVKALKKIFKGPVPDRPFKTKAKISRSTSHTRFSAVPPKKKIKNPKTKQSAVKKLEVKRRSAKKTIKKLSDTAKKSDVKKAKAAPKVVRGAGGKKSPQEFYVGEITHFFSKISVVVVKVEEHSILIGDTIVVKGSREFSQKVQSLQVESKDVRFARKGELVGLEVIQPAKPGDKVFKIKK